MGPTTPTILRQMLIQNPCQVRVPIDVIPSEGFGQLECVQIREWQWGENVRGLCVIGQMSHFVEFRRVGVGGSEEWKERQVEERFGHC